MALSHHFVTQPEGDPIVIDRELAIEELAAIELELERRKYRRLHDFVKAAWPIVEPEKPFIDNWHIRVLCHVLEEVSAGKLKRVIINVPPGTMKSLLVNVFWTAWEWSRWPHLRYLKASYSGHLTIRDNLKLRDIIKSSWYQSLFNLELKGDQDAKQRFDTSRNGWCIASSVGGFATGEHPDRIIIDDPTNAAQALSDVERGNVNQWFDRTISSRGVTRDTRIVVVMQRLHENDLTGHLLAKGGWEHIRFPMRWEPLRKDANGNIEWSPDPRDPRSTPGELLWPELFTESIVRQLELDLGPYGAAGQLQQQPSPEGGGLFKRAWFEIVDAVPAGARFVRGWDAAGTKDDGCYTVGVKMALHGDTFYIVDVFRDQLDPSDVDRSIKMCAVLDGKKCAIREEREGGSAGKAVIDARSKMLKGWDYEGVLVTGDKVTRAKPFRAQCHAGNVKLVRGSWNEAYLQELEHFPVGKFKDQVDASSCAFNALLLDKPKPKGGTWGRQ